MSKRSADRKKGQVSTLHRDDAFGELQGELKEGAEEAGFQRQSILNRLDQIDEQHAQQLPQSEAAESAMRQAGQRTRNRPEGTQ